MRRDIQVENSGPVKIITLNRPKQLNALSESLLNELLEEIAQIEASEDCRALILSGAGGNFAAGADLKGIAGMDAAGFSGYIRMFQDLVWHIEKLPVLTVAAVDGIAYGGGCELTLACDFRVVTPEVRFALPEINLGLIPGAGGTYRLPKLVGLSRAKMLLYTGLPVGAEEAFRIGLADKIVPREQLLQESEKLCRLIAEKPVWAFRAAKESASHAVEVDTYAARQMEVQAISSLFRTKDRVEGVQAFVEKRPPRFTGE